MDEFAKIFAVGIGGAVGAVARYLINISPLSHAFQKFPLPTFLINISGSFFIGLLFVLFADKLTISENIRLAIMVGLLGAFTTFSTFELEVFALIRERFFVTAFIYLLLSVSVGFIGVAGGVWVAKRF